MQLVNEALGFIVTKAVGFFRRPGMTAVATS